MKLSKKYSWIILTLLLAFLFSFGIATLLKDYFHVQRPCVGLDGCPESYSFPSRHALVSFALATVIVLNTKRKDVQSVAILLAAVISLYRVFVGYHFLVDVIFGAVVGVIVGYSVNVAFKKLLN